MLRQVADLVEMVATPIGGSSSNSSSCSSSSSSSSGSPIEGLELAWMQFNWGARACNLLTQPVNKGQMLPL